MMRLCPTRIGLIGVATLCSFMWISAAAAQGVDCAELRDMTPISTHYVTPALERANKGIEIAKAAATNVDFFSFYLPHWAKSVGGAFAELVDSRSSLTMRSTDLASTSACLRFDQLILECKIDEVRSELQIALKRGSFIAILRLRDVLFFLQERHSHLAEGALDGGYSDLSWNSKWFFDEEGPDASAKPLCPFHSDYGPADPTGYGCDDQVLQTLLSQGSEALPFVQEEWQSLQIIEDAIDQFREIAPLLSDATGESEEQDIPRLSERAHEVSMGCQETLGRCSESSEIQCTTDEFCAAQNQGTCVRDPGMRSPLRYAVRGPFSFSQDHLRILQDFTEKRIRDGLSRSFPDDWARVQDLDVDGEERARRANDDALLTSVRTDVRTFFQRVSAVQGKSEGMIFAEAPDAELEIAESLTDMRASIGELARIASMKTRLRAFVVDIASFLRRSCIFRPCQKTLDQVMKIGLEDACFPYTDSAFLEDTEDSPRWQKCSDAAEINLP